jgi:hypothetical protein
MTQSDILPAFYQCNPDVVLREEDEDGGLLYNPDTNQVKIINTTGLFIWKQCSSQSTLPAIVAALEQSFDEIPPGAVAGDVQQFLAEMLQSGFIGTVNS